MSKKNVAPRRSESVEIAVARKRFPTIPAALKALDAMGKQLKTAKSFDEIRAVECASDVLKKLFGHVDEVKHKAEIVILDARARIGEELERIPKATGRASKNLPRGEDLKKGREATGIPAVSRSRLKKLAALGETKRHAVAKELQKAGKDATVKAVLGEQRQKAKAEAIYKVATAAFSAEGPFGTVVVDWPWPMKKRDRDVRPDQDAFPYRVMKVEEMPAFWNEKILPKLEDDCHVFFWTTIDFLWHAKALVDELELKHPKAMVWKKAGGNQQVGMPQYNCEFLIWARRGSPIFIDTKKFNFCFEGKRRGHSVKPKEFYETIARVTGGSRLDVFAREEKHKGFEQYGDEWQSGAVKADDLVTVFEQIDQQRSVADDDAAGLADDAA
jgi:N6-adenosine-specific RNA methylase IME4